MAKDFNTNTLNHDEYLTPPEIIRSLGEFDLDPCAPHDERRPWDTAKNHYTEDGLDKEWFGRIWCNPPYGRETFKWLERLAEHNNGISLIFARTETKGFHRQVWEKASAVFFFEGRIRFYTVQGVQLGPANAPSCLCIYGDNNIEPVYDSVNRGDIKGKLVLL